MSTAITVAPAVVGAETLRPRFLGVLRGELRKITRHWLTWLLSVLLLGVILLPFIVYAATPFTKTNLQQEPVLFLYRLVESNLFVIRVFSGIYLLILTGWLFGMEYQYGTIRILLARGTGRLQLLFAKLLTMYIVAFVVLAVGVAIDFVMTNFVVRVAAGQSDAFNALGASFWPDMRIYVGTIAISMAVTVLLAMCLTTVVRSLTYGIGASLVWFPADNIGLLVMLLAFNLTGNAIWQNITAYWLGPNLNAMPAAVLTTTVGREALARASQPPLVTVDGRHTLIVAAVYAVIFLAVSVVLTVRRDVQQ